MSDQSRSQSQRAVSSPVSQLDAVIDRLAELADGGELSEGEFYRELLHDLVDVTAGLGAAVWTGESGSVRLAMQHQLPDLANPGEHHRVLLRDAFASGEGRTVREDAAGAEVLVILCPWRLDRREGGVLELRQRVDVSEAAMAGQLRFLKVAADLIAVYHRSRQLAGLAQREEQWLEIDRFAQGVHRPLELEATAYEIANEGRRLSGCDRLTVVVRRRGRWQAVAVSGSDCVKRRSSVVARLERLAGLVAAQRRAVWWGCEDAELPPELEEPLDEYCDASSARLVAILPLLPVSKTLEEERSIEAAPIAVLVVERFDRVMPENLRERCDAVCRHSIGALHRSLMHDQMPLRRLSCLLDRSRWVVWLRQQPGLLVFAAVLIGAMVIMGIVQAPLRVEATGTLQPQMRRHLFAPADAVVEGLLVREAGQEVGADEQLILLRDPELQFETERVLGELQTARKELAGIEAERFHADRASRSDLREAGLRSAEEEALKKQIEGLERQQAILTERREQLVLRSPIAGQVLTWDVEQLLQSRPVGRGQILLTVADPDGPWGLEVEIPDDRIADVVHALQSQPEPLTARFILATAPEIRYAGVLEKIAPASDTRGQPGPSVSALVYPEDQEAMRRLRPGASVIAKIDCGRRSLLYVLSRGLLRTIRSRLLF